MPVRILVVDAYPKAGRDMLRAAGGTEGGELYRRMLHRIEPALEIEVVHPADGERPGPSELRDWAGAAWTGSNLSILDEDDPQVAGQVALARDLLGQDVPCFGSCFAVQVAAVARGGRCGANPKGREFGIARGIELTEAGRIHPLYSGKPESFDAFTSHADHVAALPGGAAHLAANDWSPIQGADLDDDAGSFWAVQYHPEYDLHEVASLARLRERELIDQGHFANAAEAREWTEDLETLHEDPSREDLADKHQIGDTLLDEDLRTIEVRNWLAAKLRSRS